MPILNPQYPDCDIEVRSYELKDKMEIHVTEWKITDDGINFEFQSIEDATIFFHCQETGLKCELVFDKPDANT